jgi:hypothetical protein
MPRYCTKCTNAAPAAVIEHGFVRENAAKDEPRSAAATPLDFLPKSGRSRVSPTDPWDIGRDGEVCFA